MNSIAFRLNLVKQRVTNALKTANRAQDKIDIVAASKARTTEEIKEAFHAGQRHFAENQLQEALPKIEVLSGYNIEWHFIGRIQNNKTRKIAQYFSWVHTISNEKVAQRLNDHHVQDTPPLNVCIQVNIDNDPNKAGVTPNECYALATFIEQLPKLNLRGLMTVPAKHAKLEDDGKSFRKLRALYDDLNERGLTLDTLSMGMSNDFEAAIAEGATLIRVGTNIFGPLDKQH